jgi:hypothetical protein
MQRGERGRERDATVDHPAARKVWKDSRKQAQGWQMRNVDVVKEQAVMREGQGHGTRFR